MKQINKDLTDEQKKILFDGGTEAPFTDKQLDNFSKGIYSCANCGQELFKSDTKYKSTTPGLVGWPSFDKAIKGAVLYKEDTSLGMKRTEVVCARCGGHLGHVFSADDAPSGKHFCINSLSIDFNKRDK
jgi:peptide-methionine (R)-S-oxide reductase